MLSFKSKFFVVLSPGDQGVVTFNRDGWVSSVSPDGSVGSGFSKFLSMSNPDVPSPSVKVPFLLKQGLELS